MLWCRRASGPAAAACPFPAERGAQCAAAGALLRPGPWAVSGAHTPCRETRPCVPALAQVLAEEGSLNRTPSLPFPTFALRVLV